MPLWQIALACLVLAWGLQACGTAVQMRHFSATMSEVSRRWSTGFLGAGNGRSKLGAGVILLLVVNSDRIVLQALVMRGRTVFARFTRLPAVEGKALAALPGDPAFGDAAARGALRVATQQIEKAASKSAAA